MRLQISDSLVLPNPEGELLVRAIARSGRVLWEKNYGKNLIVPTGRQLMSRLLGGMPIATPYTIEFPSGHVATLGGIGDAYVEYMQWGSGGHNPATSLPLPVSPSDEELKLPLVSLAAKTILVDYAGTPPGDKSIDFTGEIDYTEAVGETISEEGLFTRLIATDPTNAVMFARKTFPPINKTAAFKLQFIHRIIF